MGYSQQAAERAFQATRRNLIINGDFDIWQRGTSFSLGSVGTYTADRWKYSADGTVSTTVSWQSFTLGQTDVPGNPRRYMKINGTQSSGSYHVFFQRVEGVRNGAGKTVVISMWAKSATSGTIGLTVRQGFGTGGSPSSAVATWGGNKTITTSWQKLEWIIDLPSISGKTLGTGGDDFVGLEFGLGTNQSINTDISLTQFEIGDHATDFEWLTEGEQLALCQRYYEKSYNMYVYSGAQHWSGRSWIHLGNIATATHATGTDVRFQTEKRTNPTVILYSPNGTNLNGKAWDAWGSANINATVADQAHNGFRWYATGSSAFGVNMSVQWIAESEL